MCYSSGKPGSKCSILTRICKKLHVHSECTWTCGPPMEMKVVVILSEPKDLQFRSEAN